MQTNLAFLLQTNLTVFISDQPSMFVADQLSMQLPLIHPANVDLPKIDLLTPPYGEVRLRMGAHVPRLERLQFVSIIQCAIGTMMLKSYRIVQGPWVRSLVCISTPWSTSDSLTPDQTTWQWTLSFTEDCLSLSCQRFGEELQAAANHQQALDLSLRLCLTGCPWSRACQQHRYCGHASLRTTGLLTEILPGGTNAEQGGNHTPPAPNPKHHGARCPSTEGERSTSSAILMGRVETSFSIQRNHPGLDEHMCSEQPALWFSWWEHAACD